MKNKMLYLLKFILLPLALLFITESVQRGSIFSALTWPVLQPAQFLAGYLLVTSLLALLLSITNRLKLSFFVLLSISLLFALISNTKQKFLGEPLLPWDFVLGKETTDIIYYFSSFVNFKIIFFFVALILFGIILFRYLPSEEKMGRYGLKARVVLLLLALTMINSVYIGKPLPLKQGLGLECITWDQKLNNSMNGMYLAFLTNLKWLSVEIPDDYSQERIAGIVNKYNKTDKNTDQDGATAVSSSADKTVKPNIIVIMNEAFWDPTLLPGVSFNQDPLPFVHSLQKEHTAGTLMVPVFGGATVNTEFEVLTGHSTTFLPGGSIAYSQYVHRPVESLASILAKQGYKTTAIHSYHNWFYRRNHVFQEMGFEKFISSEFFVQPQLKRYYISDYDVSQLIIEEAEKVGDEEPFFTFAVTMQNHGPYVLGYETADIQVEGAISDEAKNILQIYAQGVADADQALQMLVEYFEKSERPTIIVFFGDHLPALGEDYQVYRETNYFKGDMSNFAEYQQMYTVPVVLWSNYLPPEQHNLRLSPSYLAPYLLHQTGLQGSFYMDYLYSLWQNIPELPSRSYYGQAGIDKKDLADYQLLQYDLIFGEGYLYQGNPPSIVQDEYFLGREKMTLDTVRLVEEQEEIFNHFFLEITGKNFTPACQVYLNKDALKTTFVDENHLRADVAERILQQPADSTIQVKLADSLEMFIAESNCVKLNKMIK